MIQAAKIIGTRLATRDLIGAGTGLEKKLGFAICSVHLFSTSGVLLYSDRDDSEYSDVDLVVDAYDGRDLDNTGAIAGLFKGDKAGLDAYFTQKEASINRDHRIDSNSGAASGVSASELNDWLESKNELLRSLMDQKVDAYDLADVSTSDGGDNQGPSGGADDGGSSSGADDGGSSSAPDAGGASLVDDFADPSQDMPSYMDPED